MSHAEQHPRLAGMLLVRSMLAGRSARLVVRREGAEQAVRFVVGACRKVDLVYIATIAAVPNNQPPKPVNRNGAVIGISELGEEIAGDWIDHVNPAISEVADQQVACEHPKARRRNRQSPWRVEP